MMLARTARLEPVESYMAPVMQWANVAQWRQGGAHRGKKVRLVSAARLRRLEDEAEDYLLDAFGELRGDTEERHRAEKTARAAPSGKRKGKMSMAAIRKRKKAAGRGGSLFLEDDDDDAIGASDDDEALAGAASLRKLKAGKVIRKKMKKKTVKKKTTMKKKALKATANAATGSGSAKMKLSVALPNKSTRTPRPLVSRDNEHSDDFQTPNMEKENEGANIINTAPPAPRKKMPRRAAIRKKKSPGQEDPYDLSSDSDEDDNDNFIDELSPTAGLVARQKDASKGRRAIQL